MREENENTELILLSRYLSGEATPEEIAQLRNWKDATPENLATYNIYVKIWNQLKTASAQEKIDENREWEVHKTEYLALHNKTKSLMPVLKWAAGILLIIGLSLTGWLYFSNHTIRTNELAGSEITLPDGSIVTLNAFSKINYPKNFGKEHRNVNLQGEAFFNVRKNAQLPFIIKAGKAEIKVLGTSFNVKAYKNSGQVEVVVAEGTVKVYASDKPAHATTIIKGQKAIFDENNDTIKSLENDDLNFISWKTKSMIFDNKKLDEVVKTLSEVYQIEIIIESNELRDCTLTTTFDNADLTTVIKVLKSTFNIDIKLRGEKIIISGKSC